MMSGLGFSNGPQAGRTTATPRIVGSLQKGGKVHNVHTVYNVHNVHPVYNVHTVHNVHTVNSEQFTKNKEVHNPEKFGQRCSGSKNLVTKFSMRKITLSELRMSLKRG